MQIEWPKKNYIFNENVLFTSRAKCVMTGGCEGEKLHVLWIGALLLQDALLKHAYHQWMQVGLYGHESCTGGISADCGCSS